ncbi:hypothetical protein HPB47_021084 [Ixodes persulcatus]|uniref:Uncharacterized protein n=1 Tax=Ixodes persulcatus TaxID=34615 RepID=A0AC60QDM2_IXOPE|nr:hypothetical protein HPB47_021084 [Ixodes persulcatus]
MNARPLIAADPTPRRGEARSHAVCAPRIVKKPRSFEPRSQAQATGVIRGVDTNTDSAEIHAQLKANNDASVTSVRRIELTVGVRVQACRSPFPRQRCVGWLSRAITARVSLRNYPGIAVA